MIKIELNNPDLSGMLFEFADERGTKEIIDLRDEIKEFDLDEIKSITPYIPDQDPYLDRSFILQKLGISKEQDEEMQEKYK